MTDHYTTFEQLKKAHNEGVDFHIVYKIKEDRDILVMAPHGGRIEPGTEIIAEAIANHNSFSLYKFVCTTTKIGTNFHITSENFDEPKALELLEKHDFAMTIHGCKEKHDMIYVGGGHEILREKLITNFQKEGFQVPDFHQNLRFVGTDMDNICNKGKNPGIQLELSRGLRSNLCEDAGLLKEFSLIIKNSL